MEVIKTTRAIIILGILIVCYQSSDAQVFDRIKNKAKEAVENRDARKAGKAAEKNAEEREKNAMQGEGDPEEKHAGDQAAGEAVAGQSSQTQGKAAGSLQSYSNYDFVPGDRIIYFYDMAGESDAEIPGRMLLNSGSAEIQTHQGEKVLVAPAGGAPSMMPYMKEEAYLPEQFTLEFDMLANGGVGTSQDVSEIRIYFRKKERAGSGDATAPVLIRLAGISGDNPNYGFEAEKANGTTAGNHSLPFPSAAVNPGRDNWRRVAVYFNKNIGKLYIDQHRLAVLNQVDPNGMDMVEFEVHSNDEHPVLFKDFRIASGGTDSYKKVITDGKFVAYGIQFDVNKALLKPQSMGTINEFVKMMKENPDLKFEIGGHTDSDGSAERNNTLSQERADVVKAQMVGMGVAANRLATQGYGPSKPLVDNSSSENKAKNRRVEFVKIP